MTRSQRSSCWKRKPLRCVTCLRGRRWRSATSTQRKTRDPHPVIPQSKHRQSSVPLDISPILTPIKTAAHIHRPGHIYRLNLHHHEALPRNRTNVRLPPTTPRPGAHSADAAPCPPTVLALNTLIIHPLGQHEVMAIIPPLPITNSSSRPPQRTNIRPAHKHKHTTQEHPAPSPKAPSLPTPATPLVRPLSAPSFKLNQLRSPTINNYPPPP